jgi:guanylate kinase
LVLSVSVTTRAPRPGERDGIDYSFVSDNAFDRLVENGELLEWAPVVGHRSGSPAAVVERERASGKDVVLEIDVQGAAQIRDRVPDALLIFLAPPSLAELEHRLRGRGTEPEDRIQLRLTTAAGELGESSWFDHVVVNDDLERASAQVAAIIDASRSDPEAIRE